MQFRARRLVEAETTAKLLAQINADRFRLIQNELRVAVGLAEAALFRMTAGIKRRLWGAINRLWAAANGGRE